MKKILVTTLGLLSSIILFAQSPLETGRVQLNAGGGESSWGIPVFVGVDVGVHPNISIGGELSFRSYRDRPFGDRYDHSVVGIVGNGNYHFDWLLNLPSEWNVYAGVNAGYYIWNSDDDYPGRHHSTFAAGIQVGGRYFINDQFGFLLEVGGNTSFTGAKVGITLKL